MDYERSLSGKRKISKESSDYHSNFEPPSKSPHGTPNPSPIGTPIPSPHQTPRGSPASSPCRSTGPFKENNLNRQGSFNRKTIRASRGLRRQSAGEVDFSDGRSPSPSNATNMPSFANLSQQYWESQGNTEEDPLSTSAQESTDTFGDIPSFGTGSSATSSSGFQKYSGPSFRGYRQQGSKDLLDDYFARKKDRRRSSCKEITLQLLRQDTAEMTDPDEPRFRLLERQRRLTIANKLMESISDSCESLPESTASYGRTLDSLTTEPGSARGGRLTSQIRSYSAEGYNPEDAKELRQETSALLFDSVPNLQDEEEMARFKMVRRNRRRGAVCLDEMNALNILENLGNLKLDEEIPGPTNELEPD